MGLDIYGGDPIVVATREEILRCSNALINAISESQRSILSQTQLAFDWLPNPIPNIQLAFMLPSFLDRLGELSSKLQLAAEGYFSRETMIAHQLSALFDPLGAMLPVVQSGTVFGQFAGKELAGISSALAVVGLSGPSSPGKSQLVGQSVRVAPLGFGFETPQGLIGSKQATAALLGIDLDSSGSASLIGVSAVLAPLALRELADRLHTAYKNPLSSIRIESYPKSVGRQFIVYVPGTQSFEFSGKNPLNIRSNLTAMGRQSTAPSQMAVSQALQILGAGKGDRVLFVGHSQGALVSGNLATEPQNYEVSGLVSFGGPIGHLELEIPTIAIENSSDPVPTLGGRANPLLENWVTVQSDNEFRDLLESHAMPGYQAVASEADVSQDNGLLRIRNQVLSGLSGPGKEYVFEITRD